MEVFIIEQTIKEIKSKLELNPDHCDRDFLISLVKELEKYLDSTGVKLL